MSSESLGKRAVSGFIWRLLQNAGTQIVGFVVSIILARLLMPSDYGLIAIISIFINIANVFIQTGFSSAVIQQQKLDEKDKNTMFFSSAVLGIILYVILYAAAPFIAAYYNEPLLTDMFRVQSITVLIGSFSSVHQALITREMKFKKSFVAGLTAMAAQSITGITLALLGYGAWALVYSNLANVAVNGVIVSLICRWMPKWEFSFRSLKSMLGFSVKMLGAALINTIFLNIRSLIIGKQYSSEDLAYYTKGNQFPQLIMLQVDGSMTTVLFSALSKTQSDWEQGLRALRRAMKTSLYVCAPLMAGMFAVAESMVLLLLTEKWLFATRYVQVGCIICLFWPLSAQMHALNARGKSGVVLTLNIVSRIISVVLLLLTFKHSVWLMVLSEAIASAIFLPISMVVYRKHLEYSIRDQLSDILPPILLSAVMAAVVFSVQLLGLPILITLVLQVIVGLIVYIAGSIIFKFESFHYILNMIKPIIKK